MLTDKVRNWLNLPAVKDALDTSMTDFLIMLYESGLTNSESLELLNMLKAYKIDYESSIEAAYRYILTMQFNYDEIARWTSLLTYVAMNNITFIGWGFQEIAEFAWREREEWSDVVTIKMDEVRKAPVVKSI